ncbi:MAG TPA: endonuclease domain-containing protein [Candidatus Binataceae bacterium]|nr:endonuclease domain-containing protein [Candidatus Binataceae bacterium]
MKRTGSHKPLLLWNSLANSRRLRREMTDAEQALWKRLRGRRFAKLKFRRQLPIGRYIVDFCCFEKKLVVELDGGQHMDRQAYDARRDRFIEVQGFRVVRFWNDVVLRETNSVIEQILAVLEE